MKDLIFIFALSSVIMAASFLKNDQTQMIQQSIHNGISVSINN